MANFWVGAYEAGVPHEIDPDAYMSVSALLGEATNRFRDQVAFTCFGCDLTFGEVDAQADNFAAFLQQDLGIGKGDRVAVMLPNVLAFPVAFLAIARIGAIQVNVNPMYTAHELRHQLNDASVESIILITGSTPILADIIAETSVCNVITAKPGDCGNAKIPSPPVDSRVGDNIAFVDALARGATLTRRPVELSGDDTLFLQYTGGTTGLSKGAVLSHRNLIANVEQFKAMMFQAFRGGDEIIVTALPLYHVFALMVNLITYFSLGAQNILIPNPRDMTTFIASIKDTGFTAITGVNTLFAGLLAHPDSTAIDWSKLRLSMGGGAPVFRSTSEKWKAMTGQHILEGYGLSETSPILTVNPMSQEGFSASVGLPVPSTEIKLLDGNDNEVSVGEAGEICARGPQVMSGYWERDDANAEAFVANGFFRTGDIGTFNEKGYLKIVDRKKDMILVSGFNVFPNEIEATAAECDGVAESACIGMPDEKTGEAVQLFIVKSPGTELSRSAVMEHCRNRLAAYKVPRNVIFLEELPKSNVGKILRKDLRTLESAS